MAEDLKVFKSVKGTITVEGPGGKHIFEIEGSKPPSDLKAMPAYIAEITAKAIVGLSTGEAEELKSQNRDLRAKVDDLLAQLKAKGAKSAPRE